MPKNQGVIGSNISYLILIVCITSLIVSSYTLYELKKATKLPQGITINQFLAKLTSHEELVDYKDITPLNIIRIDNANLGSLQTQINGLDVSFIGSYIVQYADRLFIYNFETDSIISDIPLQIQQLPQDFFTKLLKHPELEGVGQETPQRGILDQTSLQTLKQQQPDVYKDAKAGDYLLRYPDRLVIYDYQEDKIVNAVNLEQK